MDPKTTPTQDPAYAEALARIEWLLRKQERKLAAFHLFWGVVMLLYALVGIIDWFR
jgi:hypothetical protein